MAHTGGDLMTPSQFKSITGWASSSHKKELSLNALPHERERERKKSANNMTTYDYRNSFLVQK
jgi:hypothetical protein